MENFVSILSKYSKQTKSYQKDNVICFEGSLCKYVRILVSGKIVISSITNSGQEIIYKELKTNDMFGQNLIFSNNPYYRGNVICLENTKLYEFTKEEFLDLLAKNMGFTEVFLKYQSEDSKRLNQQIKIQSLPTVEEKIFYLLQINNHEVRIKNMTDLSRKLNVSRESTSRVIHSLIKEGKLKLKDKIITDK